MQHLVTKVSNEKIHKTDSDPLEAQLPNGTKAVNLNGSMPLCKFGIQVGFYLKSREGKVMEGEKKQRAHDIHHPEVRNTVQLQQ